ncbi:hypothetical protein [Moorena sp. SIO2C4]|nr:hypothetical protein [Moorena sp. SIO2C4]NEP65397.1 hypothetical protein [Moorena sp. SIO3A5]NES43595.1 hypothetical protein [Moorena sp. SIO2C4]
MALVYTGKYSAISRQPSANQREVVNKLTGWYGWLKISARFTHPTPFS